MNKPEHELTLEQMRHIPIHELINMEMDALRALQRKADIAASDAVRAKSWLDGAIDFKLYEESKEQSRG